MTDLTPGCKGDKHKFTPRYENRVPNFIAQKLLAERFSLKGLVSDLTVKTYIRDVCVRCGATVERHP